MMIEQGHPIIDLISDENSKCSGGGMRKPGVPRDIDAHDHPPQTEKWDLPTMGTMGQLLTQLAGDFVAKMDAALLDFPREVGICQGTISPYLGSPQQTPTPLLHHEKPTHLTSSSKDS